MASLSAAKGAIEKAGRTRSIVLTALALMFLAVYAVRIALPAARADTNGFAAYYTAAHLLLLTPRDMARIYDNAWFNAQIPRAGIYGVQDIFNIQPPTMALILLPLAGLSHAAARLLWTLLSLGFLIGGLALLAQTLRLPLRWSLWILPACLLYAPITENIQSGQVYLLLFFLLCLVFRRSGVQVFRRSGVQDLGSRFILHPSSFILAFPDTRHPTPDPLPVLPEFVAGSALGLMLVLKTAAVWFWPLLLLGGRQRTLAWAAATTAFVALITLPLFGLKAWSLYLLQLPRLASEPQRYVTAYQTTTSLLGHLFVYSPQWNPAPVANLPLLAQIMTAAILLLSLALSAHWGRLNDTRREVRTLTLALFGALAVVNAPVSEGYHYTLLLPSLLIACWWAWREGMDRGSCAALALAVLLLGAPLHYLSHRLEAGWPALLAYPRVYGAFLLWGWLGWALCRSRNGRSQ